MSEPRWRWPAPRTVFLVAGVLGVLGGFVAIPTGTWFLGTYLALSRPAVRLPEGFDPKSVVAIPTETSPALEVVTLTPEERLLEGAIEALPYVLLGWLGVVVTGLLVFGVVEAMFAELVEGKTTREGVLGWMSVGGQVAAFGVLPVWALVTAARVELGHRYVVGPMGEGEVSLAFSADGELMVVTLPKSALVVGEAVATLPWVLLAVGLIGVLMAVASTGMGWWRRRREAAEVARWSTLGTTAVGDWQVSAEPDPKAPPV